MLHALVTGSLQIIYKIAQLFYALKIKYILYIREPFTVKYKIRTETNPNLEVRCVNRGTEDGCIEGCRDLLISLRIEEIT